MYVSPAGYQPIYNPCIPYLGPIGGGLREGMSILIHGTIPENTTRFFVNLLCGPSESSDVAFHLNPRFDGMVWDKVVFNSCRGGCWEAEEKIHRMPFSRGRAFEMLITATSHGFKVLVDGNEFHHFKHRFSMDTVSSLHIAGDVRIETINVMGGGMGCGMGGGYPGGGMAVGYQGGMDPGMGGGMMIGGGMGGDMGMGGGMGGDMGMSRGYLNEVMGGGYPGMMGPGMGGGYPGVMPGTMGGDYPEADMPIMCGQPVFHPTVPYTIAIPQGMIHRRHIIIRGMVAYGGTRMSINFLVSRSRDIAFHMTHRVREGILMRNSMIGGCWGQEETALSMNPFDEGQYFEISVRSGRHKFKVFVNGQFLFEFHHRFHHFHEIDTLEIEGDVQLSYVHV